MNKVKKFKMTEYIEANLKIINKYFKKRQKVLTKLNKLSVIEEFKEWNNETLSNKESVWTLPDLTSTERLKNFCRSIKKEIN